MDWDQFEGEDIVVEAEEELESIGTVAEEKLESIGIAAVVEGNFVGNVVEEDIAVEEGNAEHADADVEQQEEHHMLHSPEILT